VNFVWSGKHNGTQFLNNYPTSLFSHTHASINYQLAYQQGHGGEWWDISLIVFWDNKPSALWPLSFSIKDAKSSLSSHGLPVMLPHFCSVLRRNLKKSALRKIVWILLKLSLRLPRLILGQSAESFSESMGLSNWHAEAMARDAMCVVFHELFLICVQMWLISNVIFEKVTRH